MAINDRAEKSWMERDYSSDWEQRERYAKRLPICSTNVVRVINSGGQERSFWVDKMLSGEYVAHLDRRLRPTYSHRQAVAQVNETISYLLTDCDATLASDSVNYCRFLTMNVDAVVNQTNLVEFVKIPAARRGDSSDRVSIQAFALDVNKVPGRENAIRFKTVRRSQTSAVKVFDFASDAAGKANEWISDLLLSEMWQLARCSAESCQWLDPELRERTRPVIISTTNEVRLYSKKISTSLTISAAQLSDGRFVVFAGDRGNARYFDSPGAAIAETISHTRALLDKDIWTFDVPPWATQRQQSERFCRWQNERLNEQSEQELRDAIAYAEQLEAEEQARPKSRYVTWL